MHNHGYSDQDMSEIIKRAAAIDGNANVDRQILERTASELGISQEALQQAEADYKQNIATESEREQFVAHRRANFYNHLATYVVVNAFLSFLALRGSGSFWAIWPIMGWGIGIAIEYFNVRVKAGDSFESEFAKWRANRSAANTGS
ncbi:MAG: 2TM domain-containing protein [Fimbriimonadaceae bacterium]